MSAPQPVQPAAPAGGVASAPDVTVQLGGTDPVCTHPAGLSAQSVRNCAGSGSPFSPFPVSNYTPDTHIDTGVTDPSNDIASAVQNILGLIFGLFATVIGAGLLAVSMAFGFDLFASDHHQQIPHALATMEHLFTLPWLPVAFAVGAIVGIVRWWGQRQEGAAIGHWTLMVVCAALGLLITSDPQGTVGWADSFADQAALGTLAAASDHNPSQPAGSYANATAGMWQQMVQTPWCAVEFANTSWCTSPIDKHTQQWRTDVLAHIAQADSNNGGDLAGLVAQVQAKACAAALARHTPAPAGSGCLVAAQEQQRLQDARTNGELWLAFPSGDDARNGKNDAWTLYHHLLQDRPELAQIRGTGGVVDRLGTVIISAIGMLLFLLLLAYIVANLLLAALFFVVLLMLAPVMLLLPALGDWGRRAFWRWLGYALGALLAKVIYALYLGVLIFASAVLGAIGAQSGGWLLQWILFSALWGLAFHYRGRLLALLSAGGHHEHHRGMEAAAASIGALALTRGAGSRAIAHPARRLHDQHLDRRDQRDYQHDVARAGDQQFALLAAQRAHGQTAQQRLASRSIAMLDARYEQARETVARKAEILEQINTGRSQAHGHRTAHVSLGENLAAGEQNHTTADRAGELESTLSAAERFVADAQEHERITGQRYTFRQLQHATHAVQAELTSHPSQRDYEQLAYRLPGGRGSYQAASGDQKQIMREQIDRQLAEDRQTTRAAQHAADRLQAHQPALPRRPVPRRPQRYQRHEFRGSREHMPPVPRRS